MKALRFSLTALFSLFFVLALTVPALTQARDAQASPVPAALVQPAEIPSPGNYCVSCHTPGDPRLASAAAWKGTIERAEISPCPAARQIQEEVFYTERMLLAIDRSHEQASGFLGVSAEDLSAASAKTALTSQGYSRLLDSPTGSLEAFTSEAQVLRFKLGKNYRQMTQFVETMKQNRVIAGAVLVSLAVLGSLIWGLVNTRQFIRSPLLASSDQHPKRTTFPLKSAFVILAIFVLFALPIFRVPAQPVDEPTLEEQARQTALDTAQRAADAADRAFARSWVLARVGAAWGEDNPQEADLPIQEALAAAKEADLNTPALWGFAQSVNEASSAVPVALDKAGLVFNDLSAARSRTWALRLIAQEWMEIDPALAEGIMQEALQAARSGSGIYRDLDLRAAAVTWSIMDIEQGLHVLTMVQDPALRAWGYREIAEIANMPELLTLAADTAQQVADPIQRARVLGETAAAAARAGSSPVNPADLQADALAALEAVDGPSLAFALSDLAAAAGDASLAEQISPEYPAARASAYLRLGRYETAWQAAEAISDTYEKARAQAAIAAAWSSSDAAQKIAVPILRDLALRDIAVAENDLTLAGLIESPYYRVQALTRLNQETAALAEVDDWRGDALPLRELAIALAESDPQASLELVEIMDREVDKAAALRAAAIITGDADLFDRALGMALAARVRGDNLSPVEASLTLAQSFPKQDARAQAAFAQAYEAAQRISIK